MLLILLFQIYPKDQMLDNNLSFVKNLNNKELEKSFNQMQNIYIFNEADKVLFKDVLIGIYNLFDKLIK